MALVDHNRKKAPEDDSHYPFNDLKPSFPKVDWPPLELQPVTELGLSAPSLGNPAIENTFLKRASEFKFVTPALGVDVRGIDLKSLTDGERADLYVFVFFKELDRILTRRFISALLAAQKGVVVVRGQQHMSVHDQLEFGRRFGPLHKHTTTAVPRVGGLDEVHLV